MDPGPDCLSHIPVWEGPVFPWDEHKVVRANSGCYAIPDPLGGGIGSGIVTDADVDG